MAGDDDDKGEEPAPKPSTEEAGAGDASGEDPGKIPNSVRLLLCCFFVALSGLCLSLLCSKPSGGNTATTALR